MKKVWEWPLLKGSWNYHVHLFFIIDYSWMKPTTDHIFICCYLFTCNVNSRMSALDLTAKHIWRSCWNGWGDGICWNSSAPVMVNIKNFSILSYYLINLNRRKQLTPIQPHSYLHDEIFEWSWWYSFRS